MLRAIPGKLNKSDRKVSIKWRDRFQKSVRQIGNVSDSPKIYVEDYVDTFFSSVKCKKARKKNNQKEPF